ncbi:ABC transporter permease subunit [Tumidithrix elongata RA019]|uniref:ABC transporter permease subunit n=1 Tax=Tumidithrix elongata BACA0141 TaxID=2716417 RepID=A0AAW9PS41_9CYAN|nr:ABC transporter permease subunit [Tumidithrix elongata RA019]
MIGSFRFKHLWNWRTALQIVFAILAIAIATAAWLNLRRNLRNLGFELSFDFLNSQASFNLRETPIAYQPSDSYSRALVIGLLNSLKVSVVSVVAATVLGITAGVSRLSKNWLLRQIALVYVELFRNVPLLLQLFFWYSAVFLSLPKTGEPINLGAISLSIEGVKLPWFQTTFSSEFSALVFGLTTFSSAFIAEIVRGGIQAIPKGQTEAAKALGLKSGLVMRLIVLPQALRVIIPPLTSQYLNIAKNSSLAIAIGFEDVYAIASTTLNQTGRPVNVVLLLMGIYLGISLFISSGMNLLNRRVQFVER